MQDFKDEKNRQINLRLTYEALKQPDFDSYRLEVNQFIQKRLKYKFQKHIGLKFEILLANPDQCKLRDKNMKCNHKTCKHIDLREQIYLQV